MNDDDLTRRLRSLPPALEVPGDLPARVERSGRRRRRARQSIAAGGIAAAVVTFALLAVPELGENSDMSTSAAPARSEADGEPAAGPEAGLPFDGVTSPYSAEEPMKVSATPGCPVQFDGDVDARSVWVPAPAPEDSSLLPDAEPTGARLCAYGEDRLIQDSRQLTVATAREVSADLRNLPAADPARACTRIGPVSTEYFLMAFAYDDETRWVATGTDPNRCVAAGNGSFATDVYLGEAMADLLRDGVWTGP